MKSSTLKFILLVLPAVAALLLHGCTREPEPEIKIDGEESLTLEFGSGGEKTVDITSNKEWSASGMPEWVTITPSSGVSGTTNVTVKVAASETGGKREATVNFAIDGNTKVALTIKHTTEAVLEASPEQLSVPAEGGGVSFDISANTPWALVVEGQGAGYIESITAESGSVEGSAVSGTADDKITVVLKGNDTADGVEVALLLSTSDPALTPKIERRIVILQEADAARLDTDLEENTLYAPVEGGEVKFNISSNISWKLALEDDDSEQYIERFNPSSGAGNSEVSVIFKENTVDEVIEFAMILSSDDDRVSPPIERRIVLSQSNKIFALEVDPSEFTISGEGGEAKFNITSNTQWAVFLKNLKFQGHVESISPTVGEGDREVTVILKANPSAVVTDIELTVQSVDPAVVPKIVRTVTLIHEPGDAQLAVDPAELNISGLGEQTSFDVTGNIAWKVEAKNSADRIYIESISPTTFNGSSKVNIKLKENLTTEPITFALKVYSIDPEIIPVMEHEVTVIQGPGVPPAKPSGVQYEPSYEFLEFEWPADPRATEYEIEVDGNSPVKIKANSFKRVGLLPDNTYQWRLRAWRYDLAGEWASGNAKTLTPDPDSNWMGSWSGNITSMKLVSEEFRQEFGDLNMLELLDSGTPGPVSMNITPHPSINYKISVAMGGGLSGIFPTNAILNMPVVNAGRSLNETVSKSDVVHLPVNKLILDIPQIRNQLTGEEVQSVIGMKLVNITLSSNSVNYYARLVNDTNSTVKLTAKGAVSVSLSGGNQDASIQIRNKIQQLMKDTDLVVEILSMNK